jgi:Tol biopolymer transport system component
VSPLPFPRALLVLAIGAIVALPACSPSSVDETTTTFADAPTTTTSPATTTSSPPTTVDGAQPVPPIPVSTAELESLPGRLAINSDQRQLVSVVNPDLSTLELADTAGEFAAQPTWSPDGKSVAHARVASDGAASVVVTSVDDGSSTEYLTPFRVFYIQWRPDSGAIGVLGAGGQGTALVIVELDGGKVTPMHSAGSFYFHWSPDGSTLVTHLDSSILELVDVASGERTAIDTETGTFEAPQWTDDGESIMYVKPLIIQSAGIAGWFTTQATMDQLISRNVATGEEIVIVEDLAINSFSLSPDGASIGYTTGVERELRVVDLATGNRESIDIGTVFIWQWSPDSQKILVMGLEDGGLVLRVWDTGTVTEYFTALPTGPFFNRYLIFWGQYDRSMTLWAPDSSAFVFPASDRGADSVFLQRLEDEFPLIVAPGAVANFSPSNG